MTSMTQPSPQVTAPRARHRVGGPRTHSQVDRIREAVRSAHEPVSRAEAALLGVAGGLVIGVLGSAGAVLIGGPW